MHFNASRSLTQPLLDCMLYLTQYLYDPGILPSSANQCILGNVYLRSNLPRALQELCKGPLLLFHNDASSPACAPQGSRERFRSDLGLLRRLSAVPNQLVPRKEMSSLGCVSIIHLLSKSN